MLPLSKNYICSKYIDVALLSWKVNKDWMLWARNSFIFSQNVNKHILNVTGAQRNIFCEENQEICFNNSKVYQRNVAFIYKQQCSQRKNPLKMAEEEQVSYCDSTINADINNYFPLLCRYQSWPSKSPSTSSVSVWTRRSTWRCEMSVSFVEDCTHTINIWTWFWGMWKKLLQQSKLTRKRTKKCTKQRKGHFRCCLCVEMESFW